jgi:hypothetical protein
VQNNQRVLTKSAREIHTHPEKRRKKKGIKTEEYKERNPNQVIKYKNTGGH